MVKADSVERIQKGKSTLDFMCLDHRLEDVPHDEGLPLASQMVRYGEDSAEVIGWMTPFCSQETVIEVKPANLGADIEGTADRVELVICSRYPRAYDLIDERIYLLRDYSIRA